MKQTNEQLRQTIEETKAAAVRLVNKGMFHSAIVTIENAIVTMTEETKNEIYARLAFVVESTYEDHKLTEDEKHEIGDILADNMTPYEFICDVQSVGDIWYEISEDYASLKDIDVALEYVATDDCKTVDDWIRENGLPLPDRDDMVVDLMGNIDEEEYINEYYGDVLDMLPEQCEFNLNDDEIVHLFEVYVEEPEHLFEVYVEEPDEEDVT